jgi:hypothetical protein
MALRCSPVDEQHDESESGDDHQQLDHNGADNPREVVRQIDPCFAQLLRQMEAE